MHQIVTMRIFIPLESHNFLIAVTHTFAGYSTYLKVYFFLPGTSIINPLSSSSIVMLSFRSI